MKKILTISAITIVVVLIAVLVWFFASLGSGDGEERRGTNIFDAIFPFGRAPDAGVGPQPSDENGEDFVEAPMPRLRLISERPTSGGAPFAEGERTVIRFMDRETGHIFETFADTATVRRISNTTIPAVQDVWWITPSEAIIRSLENRDTVENFFIRLSGATTTTQTVTGTFMGDWVRGSLSPNRQTLLSVWETEEGIVVRSSNQSGGNEQVVYTSPLRSLVPLRSNTTSFIQTAPAAGIGGFLYRVTGGNLVRVLGDVAGLVALPSPNGRFVLFSSGGSGFSALRLIDTETNETTTLSLAGIASKCVWATNSARVFCGTPASFAPGNYPDAWLFGMVSFNDSLWSIDPLSGETVRLVNIEEEYRVSIDVWRPAIDEEGRVLTFINKNDLSFWAFRIEE